MQQDLRFAVRTLVRSPGFTTLTVLCLALGIGVNSTIFSVVDTVAIRPLPFNDPDRLVIMGSVRPGSDRRDTGSLSYLELKDWIERTHSFEQIAGQSGRNFSLTADGEAERFLGAVVTANLFPMLGIQPILGRQFTADDDRPGAADVVLLSHGVWQRRFGADPSAIGRSVLVNGKPTTIVGVMPVHFRFPENAQMWMPAVPTVSTNGRDVRELGVYGRLKPGVAVAGARADVVGVAGQLAGEHRENTDRTANLNSLRDDFVPDDVRLMVSTMMGAATFVLLIACGNVANLLLARATARQREIAVRAALGAGRGRIVRQLLTESVLVALASAPLGIAIAYVGLRWLSASIPQGQVPYYIDWDMNYRVVVYTLAIAFVTGLIFGLAPALQAARGNQYAGLKDGGRGAGGSVVRNRLRSVLVAGEIALSLVVLVGASLFVRTFVNLEHARAGIPTAGMMTMRMFMTGDGYAAEDARIRRVEDIVRRLEELPGVQSVMASRMTPFGNGGSGGKVVPEGATFERDKEPDTLFFGVTPHAFRALGQPIVTGRDFTDADGVGKSRVAIVNQVFAKRLWPNAADVIGQRFKFVNDPKAEWITVIGTTSDFRLFTVRDGKPSPYAFLSYPYDPSRNTGITARVAGGAPASITSAMRDQIHKSDPTLAVFEEKTGDTLRADSYWQFGLFGWMFSIFGVVALVLASVGVYGVLSYSVSQRTQEIGVRMALGASRQTVLSLVLGYGAKLALAGIAAGVLLAFGVTRVIASQLYNVSPTDPVSFLLTSGFLNLVALAASYMPARRATGVDPMIALRAE